VSGRLSETASWRAGHHVPVSRCLSATGIRFSVILFPPGSWALLTVGLPAKTAGPRRGYRVPHARAMSGVGALYTPRTAVLIPDRADCPAGACRSTAASPSTPLRHPTLRGSASRGINEGSSNSPVRSSPRPQPPGWSGQSLGLSPGLRTPPTRSRTTHAEVGTGHRARTWNYTLNSHQSISNPVVHSMRATSRRTSESGSATPAAWLLLWCLQHPSAWLALSPSSSAVERSRASWSLSMRKVGSILAASWMSVTSRKAACSSGAA
jgi:hypothetical protein